MPEQRKPIASELALSDALDRLVNLIEELRADADLLVEIHRRDLSGETRLLRHS